MENEAKPRRGKKVKAPGAGKQTGKGRPTAAPGQSGKTDATRAMKKPGTAKAIGGAGKVRPTAALGENGKPGAARVTEERGKADMPDSVGTAGSAGAPCGAEKAEGAGTPCGAETAGKPDAPARRHLNPGTLTAPLPPVLVTVGTGETANIITVAWTGILCSHPPKTYIAVRPTRHSYGLLRQGGEFVIHLPTARMARETDYCGIYTGAKVNKWEKCHLTPVPSRAVAPPTIAECPLALECRVTDRWPLGSHDVFVADIVSVSCDGSILDAAGRICLDRADLLAYCHGEYFALGKKLGKFGFSAARSGKGAGRPAGRGKPPAKAGKENARTETSAGASERSERSERSGKSGRKGRT